jgi:two-component system chemotaxis sensor kinase CheA
MTEPVMDYLYSNFDSEIIEEYLMMWDGVDDMLDIVIESLDSDYEGAINELFRTFHTIKSGSAFLGLDRISKFCHFVEEVLDKARKKKLNDSQIESLKDWLFLVSDQMHEWYEDFNKNRVLSSINPKILKIPHF